MLGSSRESLAALRGSVDALDAAALPAVSTGLAQVAAVLESDRSLRSVLSDAGIHADARRGIVRDLTTSLDPVASQVAQDVAAQRWSSETDLLEAYEILSAQAALVAASEAGTLDRVEDDLFRFGKAIDASPQLQLTLTDPALSGERKSALARDLLEGKADPTSTALLGYAAGHLRGRSPQSVVGALVDQAAAVRERVIAHVTSAVALDDGQQGRLAAALRTLTGRAVRLQVDVDRDVLGGMVVRIGDQVIDGSIATKLEQARRALAG